MRPSYKLYTFAGVKVTTMNNKENEYVYLDGMFLNEEHLIKLAMNVGCYAQAEH